ncbi:MAG: hypothetical protein ACHQ9S_06730 [Candidatus Binatia bacterium]
MKHDRDFELDLILPSQFAGTSRREAPSKKGEHQLLIAVLEDAIHCYQKHTHARKKTERLLFKEAERWIMAEDNARVVRAGDEPLAFSFENVCDLLGIDADYLRSGLQRWRDAQLAIAGQNGFSAQLAAGVRPHLD